MRSKSKYSFACTGFKLILLICVICGMMLVNKIYAQECGTATCPNIWPERSAPLGDTIRILGWYLEPSTGYDFVIIGPDGLEASRDTVITDDEGELLETAYSYVVPEVSGIYQVKVYASPWSGNLNEEPIATTDFYKW